MSVFTWLHIRLWLVAETVAVLAFVGFYKCDPANGYTCENEDNITFIITTPCRPEIKFTISVDGGSSTQCTGRKNFTIYMCLSFFVVVNIA